MTFFEELCASLNVKPLSKFEVAVSKMVNDLIFDENRIYTDKEIFEQVTSRFRLTFPYFNGEG